MDAAMTTLMTLTSIVLLFLLCREIVCWYWKINLMLKAQQEAVKELRAISGHLSAIVDLIKKQSSTEPP
jgi:hypothetical protein